MVLHIFTAGWLKGGEVISDNRSNTVILLYLKITIAQYRYSLQDNLYWSKLTLTLTRSFTSLILESFDNGSISNGVPKGVLKRVLEGEHRG